jgi:hypothetical protein
VRAAPTGGGGFIGSHALAVIGAGIDVPTVGPDTGRCRSLSTLDSKKE